MPWTTITNRQIEIPNGRCAQLMLKSRPSQGDVRELCRALNQLESELIALNSHAIELQRENQRLRHENEFMLRLIN